LPGAKRIQPGKGSQLAREIALLDRARAELAAGRSSEALATLELREREIDSPLLTPEATLIRIEALVRRGDITPARAVAERFLAQNPSSAQAERVRRLLANQRP
jgi:outer membrane protein assembly factor BamD (BamD/ComL family)